MTTEISDELKEEMIALVRDMAAYTSNLSHYQFARQIERKLPPAIDPDLLEARRIAADEWIKFASAAENSAAILAGHWDDQYAMRTTLAAIKGGRELEREGR